MWGLNIVILSKYEGIIVTKIGDDALVGNKQIASVSIPEGVIEIEENAFAKCVSLSKRTMHKDIEMI